MQKDGAALLLLAWALLLALAGVFALVRGSSQRAALAERGRGDEGDAMSARFSQALERHVRRTQWGRRLSRWLASAGVDTRAADFLLLCGAGVLGLNLLLGLFLSRGLSIVAALVAVVIGARSWGERKRRQRREAFIAQLPDLARVLGNGASAGLSMAASIELAAREVPEPAAGEMRTVVEQMRVGQPLDAAFEALRERLPSREVSVLMSTLVIQHRAGGDTVRALAELGETLEARKELLREIGTLLSGAVFSSWIVAGLGFGSLLMVNVVQPGLLHEMSSSVVGILAFVLAGILWGTALVLIRRTTRIDA
jgi:tight adherence protein B